MRMMTMTVLMETILLRFMTLMVLIINYGDDNNGVSNDDPDGMTHK